jgi:hypothetical protein
VSKICTTVTENQSRKEQNWWVGRSYTAARRKVPRGVDAAPVVVVDGGGGGGGGGRRGDSDEAPRRIPDGGPPDVAHRSACGKKVEGFI